MEGRLLSCAKAAKGFMPDDEGSALYEAGAQAARSQIGPLLEIGSYCGKSAVYLGAAAQESGTVLFTVDHHRGSEENQAGWQHHDESLVDPDTGRIDTLPAFRKTIEAAGLEGSVVALVGPSTTIARFWTTPLALLFIDGGHGAEVAWADYRSWAGLVATGGLLAIHDVFPDPADGGRPPFELWCEATTSGDFAEVSACGSLRVLRRVSSTRTDTSVRPARRRGPDEAGLRLPNRFFEVET